MKTLVFKSGNTIDFVECYSNSQYIQGAQREVLDFRFDTTNNTLDSVDALFTTDECLHLIIQETVTKQVEVTDEEGNVTIQDVAQTNEYVYENFGVRVALSKQYFTLATENGVEDIEQISVKMGQYTAVEFLAELEGVYDEY